MKFSCEKYVLQQAALSTARAAASKSPIPTLEGLLIQAGEGVRLTGYDLKRAIYTNIPADVAEGGNIVLPARLFCEMLRRMPDGIVTLAVEGETVSVKCGKANFDIVGMKGEDYPDLPVVEQERGVALPQGLLKKMINETSFAISTNEARPVYMGSLFELDNNELRIVSVDGYRLALRREAVEGYGDDCSFIVPGTALGDLERFCDDSDEKVQLSVGDKYISFTVGDSVILSRRLEGEFLNYRKAIPTSFRVNVKTERAELLRVVERVSLIVDEKVRTPLRLTFNDGAIDFACGSGDRLQRPLSLRRAEKRPGGRNRRESQHRLLPLHPHGGGRGEQQLHLYDSAGSSQSRTIKLWKRFKSIPNSLN